MVKNSTLRPLQRRPPKSQSWRPTTRAIPRKTPHYHLKLWTQDQCTVASRIIHHTSHPERLPHSQPDFSTAPQPSTSLQLDSHPQSPTRVPLIAARPFSSRQRPRVIEVGSALSTRRSCGRVAGGCTKDGTASMRMRWVKRQ